MEDGSGESSQPSSLDGDCSQYALSERDFSPVKSPLLSNAVISTLASDSQRNSVKRKSSSSTSSRPKRKRCTREPASRRGSSVVTVASGVCSTTGKGAASGVPPNTSQRPPTADEAESLGDWGVRLPLEVLHVLFAEVARLSGGAVPALVRLSRVCRLWRAAALSPHLWRVVNLGAFTKEKHKTVARLHWLLQHRLTHVRELSLAGWHKAMTLDCLSAVCSECPQLRSLSLARCRRVTADLLLLLARRAPRLHALDLSAVEPRGSPSVRTLCQLTEQLGPRLTELTLAHNLATGLHQVVTVLADFSSGLEVLDLSNMTVNSGRDATLPAERLMVGCPRLRVLCWTNSAIRLAPEPDDQAPAPGFPALEELSVAVLQECGRGVDDADLWRLLCGSSRLRLLDVRGCSGVTAAGLQQLPADQLQHLFLSRSGAVAGTPALWPLLERWRHSLLELDLAGCGHQPAVDDALLRLAAPRTERWPPPPLRRLDLCGAAGSLQAIQVVVAACPQLRQLDLTSCRALPRGLKRLYRGQEVAMLRDGGRRQRAGAKRFSWPMAD